MNQKSGLLDEESLRRDRESHLIQVKQIANRFLSENLSIKDNHKSRWEAKVIENNISQLKVIILKANRELEPKALDKFVSGRVDQQKYFINQNSFLGLPDISNYLQGSMNHFEEFNVLRYSPSYSITHDLYWITDGTVGEQIDVALGKSLPDVYEKYCASKVNELRNTVIPFLYNSKDYGATASLLNDIVSKFQINSFLASNILLLTVVESMVRELGRYVYSKQNPSRSRDDAEKFVFQFQSLETLIIKGGWRDDCPIRLTEALMMAQYIDDPYLERAVILAKQNKLVSDKINADLFEMYSMLPLNTKEPLSDTLREKLAAKLQESKETSKGLLVSSPDHTVNISLTTNLHFLLRRYKDDRNSIVHGNYHEFNKGWKTFIYLSAVVKVFNLIKKYQELYNNPGCPPANAI
jgi:hypothetical protein